MQYKLSSTVLRSTVKETENEDWLWQAGKIVHQETESYTK